MTNDDEQHETAAGAPADATAATENDENGNPAPSLRRRILKKALFLVYLLVIAEIGSRAYWSLKDMDEGTNLPFFPGRRDWVEKFYEEIAETDVLDADTGPGDGHLDVLFLGGSALDRVHYNLVDQSPYLRERMEHAAGMPVRIYNLAEPAMTTRDSLIKYRLMGEYNKAFDRVVVYHGINDARMNCCPAELFEDDYTHAAFYRQYRRMEAHGPLLNVLTLPYTLEYTAIHLMDSKTLDLGFFVPRHRMKAEWVRYGTDIKTAETFRQNLEGIVSMAAGRGEPLTILTFAWYIPPDYSLEKMEAKKLDYDPSPSPSAVELWGSPAGVRKALAAHNEVIRTLDGRFALVDAENLVPKQGAMFHDVCHLSEAGRTRLADLITKHVATGTEKK